MPWHAPDQNEKTAGPASFHSLEYDERSTEGPPQAQQQRRQQPRLLMGARK